MDVNVFAARARGYPPQLEDLKGGMPRQLFVIGDATHMHPQTVAIVGTRNATSYGLRVTRSLASAFARSGVSVVSGMARGIDAAAHRAAIESGGRTVAVLGTGVDVPYPRGHRELHRLIAEKGCVVSEYPPGSAAFKGTFPRRNRIIAALAPVTIVVEAGHQSGALITARHARALVRTIACVPGPIDSPQSAGSNHLLRDGASVIASVADALAMVGVASPEEREPDHLSAEDAKVWKALAAGPLEPDALAIKSHVTTRECLASITSLELQGLVECLLTGEVRRRTL